MIVRKLNIFVSILLLSVASVTTASAQKTVVAGKVVDAVSGENIPFAQVGFTGTTTGTTTDTLGRFYLKSDKRQDSIYISVLGYTDATLSVKSLREFSEIELWPRDYELGAVEITPGENPAYKILRAIIKNKPRNDPDHIQAYEYEVYHKMQFDLNHFGEKIKNNFLLKRFDYIWDNTDTTEDGVPYLPIILTESVEEHYFKKNPSAKKEILKGQRTVNFFKAPRITKFASDMYINPNIYQNYVLILGKSFPSPINDRYKRNYNFILADSMYHIKGFPCYKIDFAPKLKSDVAFRGNMYIHDSSYAVVQVDLEFSVEANINFVRNYWIRQNYSLIDSVQWFLTQSRVIGDFTVVENADELTGFYGRKSSEYGNIKINQSREEGFFKGVNPAIELENAYDRSEDFWIQQRGDSLSLEEQKLINTSNRLNSDPRWIWMVNALRMIGTNWLTWGKFDIGHVLTFYSYNKVEGSRVKLGFRTNETFHEHWKFQAYLAYGIRDQRFKYLGELMYYFNKKQGKHNMIGGRYLKDLANMHRGNNVIPIDHVFTSLFNINRELRRTFVEDRSGFVERQWFSGFSTRATFFHSGMSSFGSYDFEYRTTTDDIYTTSKYTTSGLKANIRFAWGEKRLAATFDKADKSLFKKGYPVISLEFIMGIKDLLGSDFTYQDIKMKVDHILRLNKAGFLKILVEGGYIWGQLPFPLLYIPYGNQIVVNDDIAFNLMNSLEFVTDKYVMVQLEHHFDGLIFNRIPGISKLKLRSFLLGKMYYGSLRPENMGNPFVFPEELSGMRQTPYFEAGFGIENIIKAARVDFLWRINYRDKPNVYNFIVKPSISFRF